MLVKETMERNIFEFVDIESLVPKNHILRKIDTAIDFSKIYEIVGNLYCQDNGRPGIDPVILFKIVLIQHSFGIPSLRRTLEEVNLNIAYRWFIGYSLNKQVPHFSTVSFNFKHRFTIEVVEQVFNWILQEAATAGFIDTKAIFIDGTHIKANANIKKTAKKTVEITAKRYTKELLKEINEIREEENKKPFDGNNGSGKTKEILTSTTDPESGIFHKGEHKKCFAYEAHTACTEKNFVIAVEVTPGNIHDSIAFDGLYDEINRKYPEHETIVADSAYKIPAICKRIFENGKVLSTAYKRPIGKKGYFKPHEYVYDEYYDCVICPEGGILEYRTTNRDGYREYKNSKAKCRNCPVREKCTAGKSLEKRVLRHIWSGWVEKAEEARYIPKYKELYNKRKETIERIFADAKEKYGMRYTQYRGLTQVTKWFKLKFAAMNLKKMAMWKWDNGKGGKNNFYFWLILRTSAEKFTIKIGKDSFSFC